MMSSNKFNWKNNCFRVKSNWFTRFPLIPKQEAAPLVIPLSLQRTFLKKKIDVEKTHIQKSAMEIELDNEAKKAIMNEALNVDEEKPVVAIPLLKQNTVPGLLELVDEKKT